MILLDTNVVSELMKAAPAESVVEWVSAQLESSLYTTSITQAEILHGIALLPSGKRRRAIEDAAHAMFAKEFKGRILGFGSDAALPYAQIAADRRRAGRPISSFDAQIAAIATIRRSGHCDPQRGRFFWLSRRTVQSLGILIQRTASGASAGLRSSFRLVLTWNDDFDAGIDVLRPKYRLRFPQNLKAAGTWRGPTRVGGAAVKRERTELTVVSSDDRSTYHGFARRRQARLIFSEVPYKSTFGKDNRGTDQEFPSDAGSRAHDVVDSAEVCGIAGSRVYQGCECDLSGAGVWREEAKLRGSEFLGQRILCLDRRSRRGDDSRIHS
jgi:toxin FitB